MKTHFKSHNPFNKLIAIMVCILSVSTFGVNAQSVNTISLNKGEPKIEDFLKLTVVGNGYSDQTIVVFIPDATWGFDPDYDAYKLQGIVQAPQLYSIIPGINLAINALPEILINLEVQLGFKVGALNTYTITATETSTFDPSVSIILDDTRDDVQTNLVLNPVYSFTADPADNIQRFKLRFRYPVNLDLKVFLEGCYNGTEMNTDLNSSGLLPLSQPFNTEPWNYSGIESVAAIPNTDVVDWVLVEMRDTTESSLAIPASRVERAAGFLLKNGSVKGIDGVSSLTFTETITDSIFVLVWHRNHLGIISAYPVTESAGLYSYDFTISSDQALGGSLAEKDMGSGVYGMIAGDTDANGIIEDTDKTITWVSDAGKTGYLSSDADLDGQADNPDKNDLWLENLSSESQVPD